MSSSGGSSDGSLTAVAVDWPLRHNRLSGDRFAWTGVPHSKRPKYSRRFQLRARRAERRQRNSGPPCSCHLSGLILNMDFENENDNPPDLVGVGDKDPEASNPDNGQPDDLIITKVPITIVTGN